MENIIQCPYCAENIKKDAQICKHCGKKVQFKIKELQKEREKQKRIEERQDMIRKLPGGKLLAHFWKYKWRYISFTIIFFFIYSMSKIEVDNTNTFVNEGVCTSEVKKLIAEGYYKSPSTVVFDTCVWKKDPNTGITTIWGQVDSQNGFGATIRSKVICMVGGGVEECEVQQ